MKEVAIALLVGVLVLGGAIGQIRCIYKAVTCNWEPVGKAEVFYTAAALTGFGTIVGWIYIEDK